MRQQGFRGPERQAEADDGPEVIVADRLYGFN